MRSGSPPSRCTSWRAGPGGMPILAGFAGIGLLVLGGLGGMDAPWNSQLPFAYSPVLARAAVTAALGVGGGLLVALACSVFEPLPASDVAPPADERADSHRATAQASGERQPDPADLVGVAGHDSRFGPPRRGPRMTASLASVVEAVLYFVPLLFFVVVLVALGRRGRDAGDDEQG